jgi:hypothetical protein
MNILTFFIIICCILLIHNYIKYNKQINLYKKAYNLSKLTNKKLLVIGDPLESPTNYLFGIYGYGDICIDMNLNVNSKNIPDNTILIKDKLENVLHKFEDNSVVIFESETLEYIDNDKIDNVINELYRISNYDIYSVHQLKPNSILTLLKSNGYQLFNILIQKKSFNHKRLFKEYPPYNNLFIY